MGRRSKLFERVLKRAVFGALAGRTGGREVAAGDVELGAVRRVLLIRLNFRMGNLLLVTPALAAIRRALPGARIDLLCADTYAEIVAHNPDIDGTLLANRHTLSQPFALARLARKIRRGRYDLVIDCARGASFLGALCAGFSRGRYRVAEAGSRYQRFFNVHLPREGRRYHKVHALLDFIGELGIPPVTQELKLHLTSAEREDAAALWRSWGLVEDSPVVGVHIGGRSGKRWPVEDFLAVGAQLARDGVPTILFAGPEEGTLLTEHRPSLPTGLTIAPPLATRSFAAVLARCAAVVTGDTGPMHLAAAVGVPTIAVFLNSVSRCYRPLGEGHRVLFDEAGVTVDAAVAAVRETLSVA